MAKGIIMFGFFLVYMGCSGGGSAEGGSTDNPLSTGYFEDGPVEGLRK